MATPPPLATLALALALGLAGCGNDTPDPDQPDTTTASPTTEPTEETTNSEPKPPGPVKTVRAWVAAFNGMLADGNSDPVYELSTSGCSTCRDWVEPFVEVHDDGGTIDGYQWTLSDAKKHPRFRDNRSVGTVITYGEGTTWPSADADPVSYEEETHIIEFGLARKGGQWLVDSIVFPS